MKRFLPYLLIALVAPAMAQSKADKTAVLKALLPDIQKACAFPVTITPRIFNLKNGWSFTVCTIKAVNPKNQGDGEAMGLLHKVGTKWKVVEWTVGSDIQEDATQWAKMKGVPKGLIPKSIY